MFRQMPGLRNTEGFGNAFDFRQNTRAEGSAPL